MKFTIQHHFFNPENVDQKLLDECFHDKMFVATGALADLYVEPFKPRWNYRTNNFFFSTLRVKKKLACVLALPDHQWGWDRSPFHRERLQDTGIHGMISLFTKPEFRGQKFMKALVLDWDEKYGVRRISANTRAAPFLAHINEKDKEVVNQYVN